MRVVTWNVWGRYGPWEDRAPLILDTLAELRPDVLCLQEVWREAEHTHADMLAAELGMNAVYAPTRMPEPDPTSGADELGIAVLGRWPVRASLARALSPADAGSPSTALVVTFDHPEGPLHVATAVPDWEQGRSETRLAQTRALAGLLADPELDGPLPVVLAADLNARPETDEFAALTEVLDDTWSQAAPGADAYTFTTANRYVGPEEWLADGRIDHVLYRPGHRRQLVTVREVRLAGKQDPPGSDHYAVVADLEWGPAA